MVVFRRTLTALVIKAHGSYNHSVKHLMQMNGHQFAAVTNRYFSRQPLSKSLELLSVDKIKISNHKNTPIMMTCNPRPMVVMLAWMLAKRKHLTKYADVYLNRGIDVLTVQITPWQLLWPVSGSQVVAKEVVQFLHHNPVCQPLYLHGFSVGAYLWAEVMVKMKQDLKTYQPIVDRIVGQVWDSAADITQIHIGLPLAVFPHNPVLRQALAKYVLYHLKAFRTTASCHYYEACKLFHDTLVRCPALLLVSKSDPIGCVKSNIKVRETWTAMNIKTEWKCWEDSKHVSHFLKYKDEYTDTLVNFLDSVSTQEDANILLPEREKVQAKL